MKQTRWPAVAEADAEQTNVIEVLREHLQAFEAGRTITEVIP